MVDGERETRMTTSGPIRVIGMWDELGGDERARVLDRGLDQIFDPALRGSVSEIIEDVRAHGDAAVARALRRYDRCDVDASALRVTDGEFAAARASVRPALLAAIRDGIDHVRRFNEQIALRGDWSFESEPGLTVGEKVTPIASAGLFGPSGKASYPSVLVQIGTPAVVAGVPEIAVVVPPVPGTDSAALLAGAQVEVARQMEALPEPRRAYAAAALGRNGGAVLVRDLVQAAEVANAYAPEHMQIAVRDEDAVLGSIQHAGEILLGQWTPVSAANFLIGCPASLPTSGFAKVSGGVTVDAFRKRTAVARADRRSLTRMSGSILELAGHEGFPAHEAAVRIRLEP